jgi:hypothetical protein
MPDMDGFKLLEHIALELDVPVMSASRTLVPIRPRRRGERRSLRTFPVARGVALGTEMT